MNTVLLPGWLRIRSQITIVSFIWAVVGIAVPATESATSFQHPRYDTYTGFSVPTTPILPVTERHPSLYFSSDQVAQLRTRKEDPTSRYYLLWQRYRADALRYIDDDMSALDENDRPRAAKSLAFWWIIEQDTMALEKAIEALLVAFDGVPQTGEKPYDEIYRATWLQNYAAAYDWVYDQLTPDQDSAIRQRIADETQYLRDNLMEGDRLAPRPHNHRSKPAWAIGTAALVLAEHEQASDWLEHALEAANTVTRYQFSADGIYREGGHYWMYNAVNLIPFLWHYYNVSGVSLFEAYRPAFEWPIRIRTGRGLMPNLEDSYLKPAPTHMVAAAYRGAPTELNTDQDFAAICQWHFESTRLVDENYTGATVDVTWEIDEYILYDDSISPAAPTAAPNQFLDGGQVVFRSGWARSSNDRYLLFHGVADGDNHNHPDQLSFFLSGQDAVLAPDAGYGPAGFSDDRRSSWYTSSRAHNIVTADGYPPVADQLFSSPFTFNVQPASRYEIDSEFFAFAEKESGYVRPNDASLRRAVGFINRDFFVVADLVAGTQEHVYRAYVHGRGAFVRNDNYASWTTFENRYGLAARLDAFVFPASASITDDRSYVSLFKDERYERHIETAQTDEHGTFLQLLLPLSTDAAIPVATDLSDDDFVAGSITRDDTSDVFLLQHVSGLQSLDVLTTDATLTWVRTESNAWQQYFVREARTLETQGLRFSSSSPVTLAVDARESTVLNIAAPEVRPSSVVNIEYAGAELVQSVQINGEPVSFSREGQRLTIGITATSVQANSIPSPIGRIEAYPNPFSDVVTITASVKNTGPFDVMIYNLLGQQIQIIRGAYEGGHEPATVHWDGHTASGIPAPSGIYLMRLRDPAGSVVQGRLVRVR